MANPYPSPSPCTSTPTEKGKRLQALILERRAENISFPKIAAELGLTQGYIYKMYKKALREIIKEPVEQLVKMENLKLDMLERVALNLLQKEYPYISAGRIMQDVLVDDKGNPVKDDEGEFVVRRVNDSAPQLAALNAYLKIMERRARLNGLDKPTKTALTDPSGNNSVQPWAPTFYLPVNGREQDITDVAPQD